VLEKAIRGIYEESRVKLPNPTWLARFFQKGQGDWTGYYRVKQALRDQIEFEHMNLLHPGLRMSERYHLIFCRNVMIYFDHATAELLIDRLCHQLHEGGYLIIGHAESLVHKPAGLTQIRPSIFWKSSH
jgi:chemotaxis protein methyltransferase CheR